MAPTHLGHPVNMAAICLALGLTYFVGRTFYYIFLSPLRSVPGPLSHRISILPRAYHLWIGDLPFHVARLHAKYGPAVVIAPGEVGFASPQAWKDIYGHKTAGEPEMEKYDGFYRILPHLPRHIISAKREEHSMLRRQLAHGFSERSMRGQEPIIGGYVDLLIQRMREAVAVPGGGGDSALGASLNMREWYNYTTFDIIGDLGLGSSFGCLDQSDYHPWIRLITDTIRQNAKNVVLVNMGLLPLVNWFGRSKGSKQNQHRDIVKAKLQQRMEVGFDERPDLIEGLLKKDAEWGMGIDKLAQNASILIIAGSETTATLLSGATFLLATNPDKLARLVQEVRSSFKSDEEITLNSVNNLTYMLACLNESLRMYPPVAGALPRQVPRGGGVISGTPVAEGTVVAVWQYSVNHHPDYWTEPMTFAPERWMGDPKYKSDQLDAMQPFHIGPRNCIGRNLAYAEMRLILAKLLFNFEIALDERSGDWMKTQKAYLLWDKPGLHIHVKPVVR
ncbi:Uu.00g078580.m01.CDS01 [Anthostomella pinea]|uniref:Uu.00g078580.m01.CDS01 n=1 Tax=Anthostomella pinea TaxID=933095 RepID=A0AAI8VLB2_9PEZI|nr:Uu.00g078580.m01.CDS01 [Anthostomella pinea]